MLSIIPFDRVTQRDREGDRERPFKAYPRTPQTIASATYYGPFAPPTFVGSVGIPASHTKRSAELNTMDHLRASALDNMPHLMDISQSTPSRHVSSIKSEQYYGMPQQMHHHAVSHYHNHNAPSLTTSAPVTDSARIPTSSSSPTSSVVEPDSNNSNSPNSSDHNCDTDTNGIKIPPKKRPHAVPVEMKDGGYWEKRKKNNESAKRSRDARRMKEEQIAMRVVYLEQENLQLRTEVSLLKSEIEKLRCMLYNT